MDCPSEMLERDFKIPFLGCPSFQGGVLFRPERRLVGTKDHCGCFFVHQPTTKLWAGCNFWLELAIQWLGGEEGNEVDLDHQTDTDKKSGERPTSE